MGSTTNCRWSPPPPPEGLNGRGVVVLSGYRRFSSRCGDDGQVNTTNCVPWLSSQALRGTDVFRPCETYHVLYVHRDESAAVCMNRNKLPQERKGTQIHAQIAAPVRWLVLHYNSGSSCAHCLVQTVPFLTSEHTEHH